MAQAQLKQPPRPQKPWISEVTLHLANKKSKLWQASLANPGPMPRLSTRSPAAQPTSLHLLTTNVQSLAFVPSPIAQKAQAEQGSTVLLLGLNPHCSSSVPLLRNG